MSAMKRIASTTDVVALNNSVDALFCQTPPHSDFHNEDGYARREYNRLTLKEQDKVMKDIYGIDEKPDEDPRFIRECLERLEAELEIYSGKKKSIEIAKNEFPAFFESEKFRLKFLRSDGYNPKLAARRLMRHLEKKLQLFGPDKLGEPITQDDLDEDDMEFLRTGGIQILRQKDRGGRTVAFSRYKNWRYKDVRNVLRSIWYLVMTLVDETEEKLDLVEISYQNGPFTGDCFNRDVAKSAVDLSKALPYRTAGYHFCFDDIRFRMVWGLITVFLGKEARLRARDHEGSHKECRFGLMSYGIPVDTMPITVDGAEDVSHFLSWLEDRRCKETTEDK